MTKKGDDVSGKETEMETQYTIRGVICREKSGFFSDPSGHTSVQSRVGIPYCSKYCISSILSRGEAVSYKDLRLVAQPS